MHHVAVSFDPTEVLVGALLELLRFGGNIVNDATKTNECVLLAKNADYRFGFWFAEIYFLSKHIEYKF